MTRRLLPIVCFIAFSLVATIHPQTASAQSPPDSDWSRIVPGDAHFFAELHDLARIRDLFQRLNIWDLVRDIGERDRPGATTRPWSDRSKKFLGMDTDDAINRLLSHHAALVAVDAAQWQNGVVLGELEDDSQRDKLIARWEAKPFYDEGSVKCYTLRGGLRLAIHERVIAMGPSGDPDGLWGRTVLLLAGRKGPQLGARAEFAALRSRMSREYQGLLYSWWEEGDPNSVADCHRLMAGFDVGHKGITAELHGQRYRPLPDDAYSGYSLARLPASTLLAYADRTDFAHLMGKKFEEGVIDPRSIVEIFLGIFAHGEDSATNLLSQLGPNFAIILSREESGDVQLPVLTAICDSAKPAEHLKQLDQVIAFFSMLIASLSASPAASAPDTLVQTQVCEGVELHHCDLGTYLSRRMGLDVLKPIECAWTVLDGQLMLSTSRRFAENLIKSAKGKSPALDAAKLAAPSGADSEKPAAVLVIRGNDTATMIESWLQYMKAHHPDAVGPKWWQTWAKSQFDKSTELGVTVQAEPGGAVSVRDIQPLSPATNLLMYNDVIVAVAGQPLDRAHPARDLAKRYHDRGATREFLLDLIRNNERLTVKIPVTPADALDISDFDPMLDLQRLQTLLTRVKLLTLTRYTTRPDRLDAGLSIEWNSKE